MRKIIFISIFVLGLGIFLYPIISNMIATTGYQSVIADNEKKIKELDKKDIEVEKEKIKQHNDELEDFEMDFVDPFGEDETEAKVGLQSYYDALNLAPAIGSVDIPKINVQVPIYHGTSEEVLSQGAGHLENSSLPSSELGTHSVITAHRGLPSSKLFRDLNKVEIGDMFFTEVLDEKIAYKVDSIDTVLPTETGWLQMEDDVNKMTLLTCEPYMINSHRMLVTGKQVPYNPEEAGAEKKINYKPYLILGALAIFLLIVYLVRRRKKRGETV